ncbi:MAG: S41 family peptidase [bacterium]|nr:S41 family peptidase [bacterium]
MNEILKRKTNRLGVKILTVYIFVAIVGLSFFAGTQVGFTRGKRAAVPPGEGQVLNADTSKPEYLSRDVDFDLYWKVWNLLKDKYVERPVSDTQLFYGSLRGMVEALEDPYTVFLDPEMTDRFTQELAGKFEGIGAEIGMKDGALLIVAPLPGSPAERAGLLAGDRILAIDGTDVAGMTIEEAVSRIRGPQDTQVTLSILRGEADAPKDIVITRDEIVVHSVRTKFGEENIAVIDIFQFGDDTTAEFKQAVLEVVSKNPKGIIVDLRNNPGGFLDSAVDIAGEWVEKNQVVVVEKNDERHDFRSPGPARLAGIPTVVLVNGGSASGAEILAGALQDYTLATLVGTKTFGKGSVQDFQVFGDGSALKFTIAEWLTPLGRSINKLGIDPDEVVEFTEEDAAARRDPQMIRALEILQK